MVEHGELKRKDQRLPAQDRGLAFGEHRITAQFGLEGTFTWFGTSARRRIFPGEHREHSTFDCLVCLIHGNIY